MISPMGRPQSQSAAGVHTKSCRLQVEEFSLPDMHVCMTLACPSLLVESLPIVAGQVSFVTSLMKNLLDWLVYWLVGCDPADRPGSPRRVSRPPRRLASLGPGARVRGGVRAR